jgi:hypothetical protein
MPEGLHEHDEQPADTEEVTPVPGADSSFAIIGMGATGGVLVESMLKSGFQNVFLVGSEEITPIDIPHQRKLYLDGSVTTMPEGEALAVRRQMDIYKRFPDILGKPERIFIVSGLGEPFSAGSILVMLECASAFLKKLGHESTQRIGVFAATPTGPELQKPQVAKDVSWLVGKLVELNSQRMFDPLVIGDRSNLCSLFDSLSAPAEEPDDVTEAEQSPAEESAPNGFGSSLYEE